MRCRNVFPMTERSRWRHISNRVIAGVFAEHPDLVADPLRHRELRALVGAAYPFGQRRFWPYKAWCAAVRDAFYKLAETQGKAQGGLHRKCPVCGVKPGKDCRVMNLCEADPVYAHELVIRDAELDGRMEDVARLREERPMHASRCPVPAPLPLFAGIEGA